VKPSGSIGCWKERSWSLSEISDSMGQQSQKEWGKIIWVSKGNQARMTRTSTSRVGWPWPIA
jgi:hypothetical protein